MHRYLASAGKDRSLCIYALQSDASDDSCPYAAFAYVRGAHKRIVWDMR